MTKEMIKKVIEENEYEFYGLRYDSNTLNVGDYCKNSHQYYQDAWNLDNYDDLTEEELSQLYNADLGCYDGGELNGTCAVRLTENNIEKAIERMSHYAYADSKLILIAGNYAEEGNDVDEIIIENAIVLI